MTDLETLDALPLIAILRGLMPEEAPAVGDALVEAGFKVLEVPLNSPRPLDSIRILAERFEGRALVGAGTVLTPQAARQVAEAKGRLIISPNMDPAVIAETRGLGLLSLPGIFTPTEAFGALATGAHALKLFPAEIAGPTGLKALRAVLPPDTRLYAVGGVAPDTLADWRGAGASGFGIGSALYKPGMGALADLGRVHAFVNAWTAGY